MGNIKRKSRGSSGISIANDNSRDSLCAGNYSVTITDNNGNLVDFQQVPKYNY